MGRKRAAKGKGSKRKTKQVLRKEDQKEKQVQELTQHSSKSLHQEQMEVEMEITLLEALAIYPPAKLRGIHRHFVLYGLTDYMQRSFNENFTADDVLKLLDRFYNLEMLKPDDDDEDIFNKEEEFYLPPSFFDKDDDS